MNPSHDSVGDHRHTGPNGDAWDLNMRQLRERNDNARKAGKEQRLTEERRVAARARLQEERGIYR